MARNEVTEGIQEQSADEQIPYQIDVSNWGSSPTGISVKAYIVDSGLDVTSIVYETNEPTVEGNVITLSLLKSLVKGITYRIEVLFTCNTTIFECYFRVYCDH